MRLDSVIQYVVFVVSFRSSQNNNHLNLASNVAAICKEISLLSDFVKPMFF